MRASGSASDNLRAALGSGNTNASLVCNGHGVLLEVVIHTQGETTTQPQIEAGGAGQKRRSRANALRALRKFKKLLLKQANCGVVLRIRD